MVFIVEVEILPEIISTSLLSSVPCMFFSGSIRTMPMLRDIHPIESMSILILEQNPYLPDM